MTKCLVWNTKGEVLKNVPTTKGFYKNIFLVTFNSARNGLKLFIH